MNISISDDNRSLFLVINLAWYHNGSKISPSNRLWISENETSLTILNTVDSDAGQ